LQEKNVNSVHGTFPRSAAADLQTSIAMRIFSVRLVPDTENSREQI